MSSLIEVNSTFKTFIVNNGILTTMAAVTIAFSTGTFIRSFVSEIALPAMYTLILRRMKFTSRAFKPISSANVDKFIKEFFSWILVIAVTFLLIQYVIHMYVYSSSSESPSSSSPSTSMMWVQDVPGI